MFPDDDVSRVAKPAVVDPDDLARMKPVDVLTAGRLPVYLEAIRHCVKEVGDEVFVSCCIPAPFSTAAALRGTAIFARDLYRNRALAMALLEKAEAATADMCAAVARAGGIPVLVDPVASGSVISPKAFAEFAAPGIVSVNKKIQSLGMPAILHICGKTSGIVAAMVDTGAAVVSLDAISLAEAREKIGKRACIMGNVAPAQTLLEGTSEIVRREAERCLAECGDNPGGFILASGCEVPIETPPANIDAMIGVARRSAR